MFSRSSHDLALKLFRYQKKSIRVFVVSFWGRGKLHGALKTNEKG